jgi:hypothetical protein
MSPSPDPLNGSRDPGRQLARVGVEPRSTSLRQRRARSVSDIGGIVMGNRTRKEIGGAEPLW